MNKRQKTIWVIILLLTFLSVILAGVKLYPVADKWQKAVERAENLRIGTDEELENIINFLENRLKKRLQYEFTMEKDPMLLTSVIYLTDAGGRRITNRRTSQMQITHIITNGKNRYVGIQYRGKNFTFVEGDSIAGGEITSIKRNGIILLKDNQEKYIQMLTATFGESITTSIKE